MYSEKDTCLRLNCNLKKPNTGKLPFLCTKEIKLRDSKARKSSLVRFYISERTNRKAMEVQRSLDSRFVSLPKKV